MPITHIDTKSAVKLPAPAAAPSALTPPTAASGAMVLGPSHGTPCAASVSAAHPDPATPENMAAVLRSMAGGSQRWQAPRDARGAAPPAQSSNPAQLEVR